MWGGSTTSDRWQALPTTAELSHQHVPKKTSLRFNPHRSNFTELSDALTEAFKTNHPIKSDYGICIQYLGYTDSRIYALELAEIELQQAAFDKILDEEKEKEN